MIVMITGEGKKILNEVTIFLNTYNLFVTSKNEFSNSRILSAAYKPKSLLEPIFNGVLVLIYYFKKHFKPRFLILKTFCSTLNL